MSGHICRLHKGRKTKHCASMQQDRMHQVSIVGIGTLALVRYRDQSVASLCYISPQIIGSTLELILGMHTALLRSLPDRILGNVSCYLITSTVRGDWSLNDVTSFRKCCKMIAQVAGAHVHRRACLLTFSIFF